MKTGESRVGRQSIEAVGVSAVRTVRCLVCGGTFLVSMNRPSLDAIIAHCETEHPHESRETMKHNRRIKRKIRELEKQLKYLWEETQLQRAGTDNQNEGGNTR